MDDKNKYDESAVYQIRVKGTLDPSWSEWFNNFDITVERDETILTGTVADQSALHGILAKINNIGMTLLTVTRMDDNPAKFEK